MKIIIGASGGIGSYLYHHYRLKEDVVGTFLRNGEESEYMWMVDISDPAQVMEFSESVDLYDKKVCLINCAGISNDAYATTPELKKWDRVIDVNLKGTFYVINAFLTFMRFQNYGRIINMGSVVAQKGVAGTSAYAASKAGLWGMTKAIAEENKDKNITINTLNLGYIDAGMGKDFADTGGVHNIINAIDFLVNSEFVTGTSIDINGGLI